MVEIEDKLGFQNNSNVKGKLGEEKVYFSDKIQKKTGNGLFVKYKERNFVVTDNAVYNFRNFEIRRRIKIEDLKGITISTKSNQFILHCNQNEYDYLFIYPDRKKLSKVLQSLYKAKTNLDLLFSKKLDKDLSKLVVGKKERTKNPFLFKINQNELTPIEDYIENNKKNEESKFSGKASKAELSINISSGDQSILNFHIACEKKDVFNTIINKLYMQYPQYKEIDCYFMCNGKRIKDYQTIEENGIKDGAHVIIYQYESDD